MPDTPTANYKQIQWFVNRADPQAAFHSGIQPMADKPLTDAFNRSHADVKRIPDGFFRPTRLTFLIDRL